MHGHMNIKKKRGKKYVSMRLKPATSHISSFISTPKPPDMGCINWLLLNTSHIMNDGKFHIQFCMQVLNVGL